MYTFGIKKEDSTKEMAIFCVTGPMKFTALKYSIYKFWNIKVNCEIDILD